MSMILNAIMGQGFGPRNSRASRNSGRSFRHSGEDASGLTAELKEEVSGAWPIIQNLLVLAVFYTAAILFYNYEEGWDVADCIYFLNVTIFTVGYGDYSPTSNNSRLFTILVILFGLVFVFKIVEQFASFIIEYAEEQAKALLNDKLATADMLLNQDRHKFLRKRLYSIFSILLVVLLGSIFYWQNEDWDFIQAFYFCIVTTTTVGYGDLSPANQGSRIFTLFYIPISVCAVAAALGNFTAINFEIEAEKQKLAALSRKLDFAMLRELDTDGKGVDKCKFLVAMLVQTGVCDKQSDIDPWLERFDDLDADGSGTLDDDDIKLLEQQEADKEREKENGKLGLGGSATDKGDKGDKEDLIANSSISNSDNL